MLRTMATVCPIPSPMPVRAIRKAITWSPIWVPALLFWQISVGGLRPALAEQKRLEDERPAVKERHNATSREFEEMSAEHRAWDDPVYRERLRRANRAEGEASTR